MATLKKYDLSGKEIGEVIVEDTLLTKEANSQMIKDYLIAIRANARQWSAHTKSRSEVSHSGQKPHPQKGTGRARQGYLGAPQYKGGGRVGTPRAKFDQHVSINQKEKRAAVRYLLSEKIQGNQLFVLKSSGLKKPATRKVVDFLAGQQIAGKRVLFLGLTSKDDENFIRSMRNIPKAEFMLVANTSGYDVAVTSTIVVLEPAVEKFLEILGGV
ncbi:MAG: 50S ribosomal protein L4 [Rhabdochlamydiaceae bacterium]